MTHKNRRDEELAAAIAAAADAPPPKVGAPDITRVSARANTVHQVAVFAEAMKIANAQIHEIIKDVESREALSKALEERFTEVMINRSQTMDRGALRMLLADTDKRVSNAQNRPEASFHYLVDHCLRQAVTSLAQQPEHSWMSEVADAPREADWNWQLTATAHYLESTRHVPTKPPKGDSEEADEAGRSRFIPAKPFNSEAVNGGSTAIHESGVYATSSAPMLSGEGVPKATELNLPETAPDRTDGLDASPAQAEKAMTPPAKVLAPKQEKPVPRVSERATCSASKVTSDKTMVFNNAHESLVYWLERNCDTIDALHDPNALKAMPPEQLANHLLLVRETVKESWDGKALLDDFFKAHRNLWNVTNPVRAKSSGPAPAAGTLWGDGGIVVPGNQPRGRFD